MTTEPGQTTAERETAPAAQRRLERTAPLSVDECPPPPSEYLTGGQGVNQPWTALGIRARLRMALERRHEKPGLSAMIRNARILRSLSDRLLRTAALILRKEGARRDEISELTGRSADSIRDDAVREHKTQSRRDYSIAYYERHPGRIPGQWYAVEDDDPDLPDNPIGVRTRQTALEAARWSAQEAPTSSLRVASVARWPVARQVLRGSCLSGSWSGAGSGAGYGEVSGSSFGARQCVVHARGVSHHDWAGCVAGHWVPQ
ncbi:hypothetical protein ACWGID_13415 [Kribbella sp. NPDC054772]